jgi:nucleoside-diphosphate-sugar epimerase
MARIFLAGASGIIGQRLVPLLVRAGHQVTGTTRTEARAGMLRTLGATPVVVDVFEASLLARVMAEAAPEIVIHELTSLPDHVASLDAAGRERAIRANARIRTEGTPALVAAATACGARRLVAQSILWIYAPGREPHVESDPIDVGATGLAGVTVRGVMALERTVLGAPMDSVVLRYGYLYGQGSGHEDGPWKDPALHVDAAAHAAFLAVDRGAGVYNVAESSLYASSEKARRELGFDAGFRG